MIQTKGEETKRKWSNPKSLKFDDFFKCVLKGANILGMRELNYPPSASFSESAPLTNVIDWTTADCPEVCGSR
jgi:hypothetical protein